MFTTCHVNGHCGAHTLAHSPGQQGDRQQSRPLFGNWLSARSGAELPTKAYLHFPVESVAFGVALCEYVCVWGHKVLQAKTVIKCRV